VRGWVERGRGGQGEGGTEGRGEWVKWRRGDSSKDKR